MPTANKSTDKQTLIDIAQATNSNWEAREGVDWQEAEDLVAAIASLDSASRNQSDQLLNAILEYANEHDDWDSEVVAGWPDQIIRALEMAPTPQARPSNAAPI